MAQQEEQCLECLDLQALPAPELQAVVSALKAKGGLLRASTVCREAVLTACKVAKLQLYANKDQSPTDVKAHLPLLKRLCTTAPPGLDLWLEAEPLVSTHQMALPLYELLQTESPLHLENVYGLVLQVTTCM
jgi:hypothetical protein